MSFLIQPSRFQAAPGYDADAAAYFAAMTAQPDATRKSLLNDLIVGLKADGVWSALDWLCILAAPTAQAGRVNAKNPAKSISNINSPTFTADLGYQGDGVSSHLDFGELFSAAGNQYALNSATVGSWCNLQGAGTAVVNHIGVTGGTGRLSIRATGATGNETFNVNDTNLDVARAGNSDRRGHRAASRTSAILKSAYFNGSPVGTASTAPTSLPGSNGAALRTNTTYAPDRMAAVYSGAGFSDAQAAAMHARLNTFLTAIGAN